jgi:hypothetical protein
MIYAVRRKRLACLSPRCYLLVALLLSLAQPISDYPRGRKWKSRGGSTVSSFHWLCSSRPQHSQSFACASSTCSTMDLSTTLEAWKLSKNSLCKQCTLYSFGPSVGDLTTCSLQHFSASCARTFRTGTMADTTCYQDHRAWSLSGHACAQSMSTS